MSECTKLTKCLACGSPELVLTLDLGIQPLANSFKKSPDERYYPLAVNRCTSCFHLQLTHVVDPSIIYKNYSYVSSTSQTYVSYMNWFSRFCSEYARKESGRVLDVGCNDGSQLDAFKDIGFLTYGVDPAENIYPISKSKGHKVVCGFWDEKTVGKLDNRQFDIVVAQNSFAHNPDPLTYLTLLKPFLGEDGLFFVQTSQADMVRNGEFDTIYHEHVNFYNINSMNELCRRAGLYLIDAIKTPVHGVSYVFVISTKNLKPHNIQNLISMESCLRDDQVYVKWANSVESIVSEFSRKLKFYRSEGYKVIGYGAAAKGMTLLNFSKVDLDVIIDDNPLKQGTLSPGRNIPVEDISYLSRYNNKKAIFVPLAWNCYDEIRNKILAHRSSRDTTCFLKYFPEVSVEI